MPVTKKDSTSFLLQTRVEKVVHYAITGNEQNEELQSVKNK